MDKPQTTYHGVPVSQVVENWRENAYRWPHMETRIIEMCDAAMDAIDPRNGLVHSHVLPYWTGQRAQLHKPVRKEEKWAVRSVQFRAG
ncbi:hypothetical protein [Leekyejoonella antrihumi]|uniref:Uncharacterized protein n=1 Tax=Leekyejoonella antrihumi TaxID=1660198 RepID=A0A563DX13_9MICO|nr:hypothetical protein [Leekyejoonella antrihumi]TWP34482.1 hypothetical protein FGL98_17360 [Leekyejoonella antrihumi]